MAEFQPADVPWELQGSVIRTSDGVAVCYLSSSRAVGEGTGRLIAAAPRLAAALSASIEAIQEIAVHNPPQSPADIAGARAVTVAFAALELAGRGHAEEGAGSC